MRGGLERWKRGASSHGVRQAIAYAFDGTCDAHLSVGAASAAVYSAGEKTVTRFSFDTGEMSADELDADALAAWVDGRDPLTGEPRGRVLTSPDADLLLDGTINAPKSFSIAALLHPELAAEFEALQDRLRDRVIRAWATELNARRGAGGAIREKLTRVEVVELTHRRSRALDPHVHRHLWLSVKVRGEDGKWSNVDSRVAMRFHTVVNAEGELAARTDPQWIAALARHGYTIGPQGEIRQLVPVVKPMSRRSNQIEANRAMLLGQWREDHPGLEPASDALRAIDRRAWALGRPNKPQALDEEDWEQAILQELREIDPRVSHAHAPVITLPPVGEPDVALLAAKAVVDADERSTGYGGRFSVFDIRAGALRAVAASGVVSDRVALDGLIKVVVERALSQVTGLLDNGTAQPQHVKSLMAPVTWRLKTSIDHALSELTESGIRPALPDVENVAHHVLDEGVRLSERQLAAASAIAGTDRLVSITGPAGSGKTSMLRVARTLLDLQRRQMILIAPTKKAATVAARETGCQTASVHALLFDYGWRWATGATGAQEWTRLHPGDRDPLTNTAYPGPRRHSIRAGDRVVIDEAGMVDLHASDALLTLARETGAGLSMVGDHLQAAPVGHAGAMAALTRRATAVVELNTVHRFADPAYGQLTLRLREPSHDQALDVAAELDERGHVLRADSRDAARAAMVDRYFAWTTHRRHIALVTASNDEADAINDAIQRRRVDAGELDPAVLTVGAEEQRILVGDTVQTRRNDSVADVENRATWHVHAIGPHAISLVSVSDPAVRRTVSVEYAVEYLRLAYASTVHGAQGETTDVSIVGPDVDAAGLYVGMTRGRIHNEAIVVATNPRAARAHLAEAMRRGLAEVSVEESRRAAATDLHRAARDPAGSTSSEGPVPASGTRGDWTRRAQRTLRRLSAQAATRNARHHGTPNATDHASLDDQIEQLRHTIESEEHSLEGELSHLAPTTAGHDASSSGLHRTPEGIVGVD